MMTTKSAAGILGAVLLLARCLTLQAAPPDTPGGRPPSGLPIPDLPFDTPGAKTVRDLSGPAFLTSDIGRQSIGRWFENAQQDLAETASGPLFTSQATNDVAQDVEAAIMSVTTSSYTATSTTYIKNVGTVTDPVFRNYFATTTDFQSWSSGILAIPGGYIQSGDPLMEANVFTNGVAPKRMYTVGIIFQGNSCSSGVCAVPNAVGIWRSNDGGFSWSSPVLAEVNNNTQRFIDKPDIAVSWYSGTRGWVYVAYLKLNTASPSGTELFVRRSTNGGVSFGAAQLVTTGRIQGPQIVVSPLSGNVFVVWSDFQNNAIKMSWATSSAQSWSTPETAATGNLVFAPNEFLNGNVRAVTLSMARYNWVADRLSVVWHERETSSPTSTTDVYFTARTSSGWLAKKRLNSVQTRDQFMPSIDFDSNGNHMTFYYDRSGHSLNELYQPDWVQTSPSGSVLSSGTVSSTFSDPDLYGNRFIGDYQDIWYWLFNDTWGDRFNGAWVKQQPVPGTGDKGDIYVTGIQ